jgi:hypothetical protein
MSRKPYATDLKAEQILPSCERGRLWNSTATNALDIKLAKLTASLDVAIDPFFTMEELDQLAGESGFTMRSSKLKGSIFFSCWSLTATA